MTDLVNKYRPTRFDQIIGQDWAINSIRNLLKNRDDLNPTFLFCGPHSTGKTTLAWLLALHVNCADLDAEYNACGKCDSCKDILSAMLGTGEATAVIEKSVGERGVDAIRTLESQARYKSESRRNVFILDEAHMLTDTAFKAALRLFENPPSKSAMFVLCTTNPEKIPTEIISRAVVFSLDPIPPLETAKLVYRVAKAEGIDLSKKNCKALSEAVEGYPREALNELAKLSGVDGDINVKLPAILKKTAADRPYKIVQKYVSALFAGKYALAFQKGSSISEEYLIDQTIKSITLIYQDWLDSRLVDPSVLWIIRDVNVKLPARSADTVDECMETFADALEICTSIQDKLKDYKADKKALINLMTIRLIQVLK